MRKNTTYTLPAYIQLTCIKSQFKNVLILILKKGFLGVISLTFIPFAEGGGRRIRKILDGNIKESSHTPDFADMAVTPPVLPAETSTSSVLNDPDISAPPNEQASTIIPNWGREPTRGFPTDTLNKVQDTVEDLIANEQNAQVEYELQSLWLQLEEKILSGSLTIPEVIDLLREEIFKDEIDPYKIKAVITVTGELLIKYPLHDTLKISQTIDSLRDIILKNTFLRVASIELIEKLLIKYPLSQPEVLKTLNLLQIELSLEQTNTFIRSAIIQCIGKVLGQYNLPEKEKLKALNQIKEFLFQRDFHIRTADQDWDLRKQTLITLSDLLNQQGIISDPEDRRDIALKMADRISKDDNWGVRQQAVITLGALLNQQGIISDPEDRKDIALKIAERISKDDNWGVRKEAVIISGALLQQQIVLFDPENKRNIILKIAERMTEDEDWRERSQAIITLSDLLNQQGIISDPEDRRDIALKIAVQMTEDEDWGTRKQAVITLGALLNQQGISDPEDRKDIALKMAKRISKDERWEVRKQAIITLGALLNQQGISDPEDKRDIILKIAEQMTEDEDWGVRNQAFITLSDLLNQQGIISDPEDKRDIILKIADQMTENEDWGVRLRQQVVITLGTLLNQQGIISDPEDRRDIALKMAKRISKDKDWRVRKEAVIISSALLQQQDFPFLHDDKRDIAFKIVDRITKNDNWSVQKQAIITLGALLNQQGISDPEDRKDIAHIITTQIFDTNNYLKHTAARTIKKLWFSDLPLPEKLNIIQFLSENIYIKPDGKKTALNVLRQANKADLPLDFDMIYKVTDMVSEPSALGKTAENLVREYLTQSLSDDPETDASLRLTLHLALEEQLAKKSQPAQPQTDKAEITACQKSMLASGDTPPDAS